jgi:enoyl-CoA hydratase/carnithine racemase
MASGREVPEAAGLKLDIDGAIATVTLNRPERRNAMSPSMWHGLAAIGDALPTSTRVVIVRGAGSSFSAGIDLRLFTRDGFPGEQLASPSDPGFEAAVASYQAGYLWLRRPDIVSIAAVRGYAIGGGFQLALACDLRVVADDVKFCMAETALGIVPDLGGTYPLVHTVGYARAVDICLTGRRVGAEEAVSSGLALRSVPVAELDAAVDELAAALVSAPPKAATATLGLLAGVVDGADPAAALAAERAAQVVRLRSLAAGEG